MSLRRLASFFFELPLMARLPEPKFTILPDIPYGGGGGKPLPMDVFLPLHPIRTPAPAVLWIHGGGWEQGSKDGDPGAVMLANEGFVTASLAYRLSGDSPFPAAIEDCKCAIRFLRANAARFGIDPESIGVAGTSAGGHLAELAATAGPDAGLEGAGGWAGVSSRVQAAAAYFGISDFTAGALEFHPRTGRVVVKLFRGAEKDLPELYRKASPIFHVSKDSPPLFLAHGDQDELVPFDQSVRMAEAYRRAGLEVEFVPVENAGHDFTKVGNALVSPSAETVHRRMIDFFKRTLAAAPTAAAKP